MKKKVLIILPLLVVAVVFVGVFIYYNREDAKTSLTVNEKKWVEENDTTMIDISVVNDYPLYGLNGEGVFFNFLDDVEKDCQTACIRGKYDAIYKDATEARDDLQNKGVLPKKTEINK